MSKVFSTSASRPASRAGRVPRAALLALLSLIYESKVKVFSPAFSRELGYYYPEVFKIAARYKVRETDLLEELAEQGVLDKKYHESIVLCPRCGSHDIVPKLKCPFCGSEKLRKVSLVSHVKCGAVNEVERLGEATCRKCGELLTDSNTVPVGVLYTCTSCGSRFEIPHPMFRCASCGAVFDHKDAALLILYVYEVREERVPAASKKLVVEELRETAESMGLAVRTFASVEGKSGLTHPVDMVVTDGKKALSLDIIVRSPTEATESLSSIAKQGDAVGSHEVLIPKIVKDRVGASEGVEGYSDYEDLKAKFTRILESFFGRKAPK